MNLERELSQKLSVCVSACVCVKEGERENLKTISEGIQTASDTIYVCTTNR